MSGKTCFYLFVFAVLFGAFAIGFLSGLVIADIDAYFYVKEVIR